MALDSHSPPELKIALFQGLFRGRQDVYSRRFESRKTGRSGYSPVCANEWVRGICEKPRIKCNECPHRRFLPLTDEVIRWHLSGQDNIGRSFVLGVYPMLEDESCFFLAADFDKSTWQEDSRAFLETCRRMNLPAALEFQGEVIGAYQVIDDCLKDLFDIADGCQQTGAFDFLFERIKGEGLNLPPGPASRARSRQLPASAALG